MQLVADDYMAAIRHVTPRIAKDADFFSSLLGRKLDPSASLGPSYWVDNLTKPVLLASSLRELYLDAKPDVIVEIGSHSALEGPIKQILRGISPQAASQVKYLPSLVRNQHATAAALGLAGGLFCQGQNVHFGNINQVGGEKPSVLELAPYPWSKQKHWFDSRVNKQHRLKPFARHDLLGLIEDTCGDDDPTWRNTLSLDDVPWLKNRQMHSRVTFSLAGFLSMAVETTSQRARLRGIEAEHVAGYRLREVHASKPLHLDLRASTKRASPSGPSPRAPDPTRPTGTSSPSHRGTRAGAGWSTAAA